MVHTPEFMTLRELIRATPEDDTADEAGKLLNLGNTGHDNGCCDKNNPDPDCLGYRIYTPKELRTRIRITWAEHVITPKYNGDANYQLA